MAISGLSVFHKHILLVVAAIFDLEIENVREQ